MLSENTIICHVLQILSFHFLIFYFFLQDTYLFILGDDTAMMTMIMMIMMIP